jgi:hypothetical protein
LQISHMPCVIVQLPDATIASFNWVRDNVRRCHEQPRTTYEETCADTPQGRFA